MSDFSVKLQSVTVPAGKVAVFWLGQAGYAFKTPSGQLIALDPYLSDCCNRYFGFKRLMAHILQPRDVVFDWLLCSHAHYDHFDPDSVPILLENGHTKLIGAKDILPVCERLSLKENITTLSVGDTVCCGDMTVTAVACDHGKLAPDALGLLLTFGGVRIYFMGDTAYRPDLLDDPRLHGVDLLILPINGAFGNLNEEQAALVVKELQPRMATPCHFWNFAAHGGDPAVFEEKMKETAPACAYNILRQGEGMIIG